MKGLGVQDVGSGKRWLLGGIIVVLLAAGAGVVYVTGGTAYAWPYVMFLPILVGSAWFGVTGGVVAAVASGLLLGPVMPMDVATGEGQTLYNWLVRMGFFVFFGGLAGVLFMRLETTAESLYLAARTDRETGLANQFALQQDLAGLHASGTGLASEGIGLILLRAVDLPEALEVIGSDSASQIFPEFGRRFRDSAPGVERIYRFSNSEMAVLMRNVSEASIAAAAEKLRDTAEAHVSVRGIPVRLEVVAGASFADEPWVDGDALTRRARIALFKAIDADHNFELYSQGLERNSAETVHLIARLRAALDAEELSLWYQPKINLRTGRPMGCEGLIRWLRPDGTVVPPDHFIPKVESTSLIKPVTEFVIRTACVQAVSPEFQPMSINFSARSLFDPEILEQLHRRLNEHGIGPDWFEIEITERALIRNPEEAVKVVEKLRRIGVGVSIDDFGTGYSSFEYLRNLPVTGLKIDRVFTRDIEADHTARNLLRCMIEAGHALDLTVTAEGVETRGQYAILREIGCDIAQGFLFTPPMPLERYLGWLHGPHEPYAHATA